MCVSMLTDSVLSRRQRKKKKRRNRNPFIQFTVHTMHGDAYCVHLSPRISRYDRHAQRTRDTRAAHTHTRTSSMIIERIQILYRDAAATFPLTRPVRIIEQTNEVKNEYEKKLVSARVLHALMDHSALEWRRENEMKWKIDGIWLRLNATASHHKHWNNKWCDAMRCNAVDPVFDPLALGDFKNYIALSPQFHLNGGDYVLDSFLLFFLFQFRACIGSHITRAVYAVHCVGSAPFYRSKFYSILFSSWEIDYSSVLFYTIFH